MILIFEKHYGFGYQIYVNHFDFDCPIYVKRCGYGYLICVSHFDYDYRIYAMHFDYGFVICVKRLHYGYDFDCDYQIYVIHYVSIVLSPNGSNDAIDLNDASHYPNGLNAVMDFGCLIYVNDEIHRLMANANGFHENGFHYENVIDLCARLVYANAILN